ncbi:MAG TPA: PDZ domain-containing protein [Bryobacteraceae bacterium]|jgi:membrane-associated protease RseP (regulator of RpoE activity)|nr:PDZ domain-containing protein [Bryobacteraceae bacterium]
MRKLAAVSIIWAAIWAAALAAQTLPPLPARGPGSGLAVGRTVTGNPYSAVAVTEATQIFADGNRIVKRKSSMQYRDREGRERREIATPLAGAEGTLILIVDPVAGASWVLNTQAHTANRTALPPQMPAPPMHGSATGMMINMQQHLDRGVRVGGTAIGSAAEQAGIVNGDIVLAINGQPVKDAGDLMQRLAAIPVGSTITVTALHQRKETDFKITTRDRAGMYTNTTTMSTTNGPQPTANYLGVKTMEGVAAEGRRTTVTVPAGAMGNEHAFEIVNETWYSADLEAMVLETSSDPRVGDSSYRLTGITRGEPDPALFQVPKDFQILQQPAPMLLPARR